MGRYLYLLLDTILYAYRLVHIKGQWKKYEQLLSRKFIPNIYMSAHALRKVGLFEEVNMYIARMGREACV